MDDGTVMGPEMCNFVLSFYTIHHSDRKIVDKKICNLNRYNQQSCKEKIYSNRT